MRLTAVHLHNFRRFKGDVKIPIGGLTALIGKNDIGKSSILEAIGIFLSAPGLSIDASDRCVHAGDNEVSIGCSFTDLPAELVIDTAAPTTLAREFLLNAAGELEVYRVWEYKDEKLKDKGVFARANHPYGSDRDDLLLLKNEQLKARATKVGADLGAIDERFNSQLRSVIWNSGGPPPLSISDIPLNKEDAKVIWGKLSESLPNFALFKADRPSTDQDEEVQDPMKVAVKQAVAEAAAELSRVKEAVQAKAIDVAKRTLEKLHELDPALSEDLAPEFSSEPKWDSIFKLSLTSANRIPLNKRGSGFRRLVLLSFFRAEAERQQIASASASLIYAIEEPESSQHPDNQRLLIEALKELSTSAGCQVLLTTHVPALAALIPKEGLRHIIAGPHDTTLADADGEAMIQRIADDLGVIPDRRVQVIVCLEGPNDVSCLQHFARTLRVADSALPDLDHDPRILMLPLGGSTLRDWVTEHYLRRLGIPEFHIYDRGTGTSPAHEAERAQVNSRSDRSSALHTSKSEMENYLHPTAIAAGCGVVIVVTDTCDVPELVAKALHSREPAAQPWDGLSEDSKKRKHSRVKRRLNNEIAGKVTMAMLDERGAKAEIISWLTKIRSYLT
jgi:predicted ATPase